jgi:colanic acid/amylovoran biosynthesis protein
MKPLRVRITNCVLSNGGDAAIVTATMASLSSLVDRPIEFIVSDQQPDVAARLFPEWHVRPWPWRLFCPHRRSRVARALTYPFGVARGLAGAWLIGRRLDRLAAPLLRVEERVQLHEYARADLVVSRGGTYLVEHYRLAAHRFDFRLAHLLRRRLVLAPQSLGPFGRGWRTVFARATVWVRDDRSVEHLLEIGVPRTAIHVGADTAFATAEPAVLEAARDRALPDHPRVAVSVREWPHAGEQYRAAIAALVTYLVREHKAEVTFLSTCQGVPEYVTDDSAVARSIAASLPADVVVEVDAHWHAPDELRATLKSFDLVVATRMHAAILALAAGVPVFPIAYEFKTDELFAQLGLARFVQDIETIDADASVAALGRFIEELPGLRPELFARVEEQRASALEAMRQIAAQLERA